MEALKMAWTVWNVRPRNICADDYFMTKSWRKWMKYYDINPIPLGPHTPWPNRAEAGVRQFSIRAKIYLESIEKYESQEPVLRTVTMSQLMQDAAYTRNCDLTYGGKTPLEIATGRKPPDVVQIENMNPGSLSQDETELIRCQKLRMRLAQEAHLQARQRLDLRRDLAAKLLPSHGPLEVKEAVWYWARDMSKIRGGQWLKAKILAT